MYMLQMALYISDLSVVGLTLGRTFITSDKLKRSANSNRATAHGLLDTSPYGMACTVQELVIIAICVKNLSCAALPS